MNVSSLEPDNVSPLRGQRDTQGQKEPPNGSHGEQGQRLGPRALAL